MIAIQLHDYDEEIIGTVWTENSENYNRICEFWNEYLKDFEDTVEIGEFEAMYGNDIFTVLWVESYQPSKRGY